MSLRPNPPLGRPQQPSLHPPFVLYAPHPIVIATSSEG
jgi:hypothetical protein